MRPSLLALALSLPMSAHAGDPCPIDFVFHDLGAPEWLDRAELLDGLKSKDSWAGVSFTNGEGGVKLTHVQAGSPAAKAGLHVGDLVTAVGETVVKTHPELAKRFREATPGVKLIVHLKRGEKDEAIELALGRQDPLVGALVDHASKQQCASVRRGDLRAEQVKAAQAKLFTKQRRFRCDDAHVALEGLDAAGHTLGAEDMVVVRGSKRVLLSSPGFATVCVRAAHYDGAKLNAQTVGTLFEQLTGKYVADRHANP